jgi:NADPH:quinone reductase-like Zn-dependent oxidoreductase
MSIPDEQTAWVVVRQGFPNKALSLKTNWPVPKELGSGEVLVKIQAAALNPVYFPPFLNWKFII